MERLKDHIAVENPNPNRVHEAIFHYAEEENKLKIVNPVEGAIDAYNIQLKLNYYKGLAREYRKTKDKSEIASLFFVRHEIRKLEAKLNPTLFNRIYYSDLMEAFKNWMRGEDDPVSYYQKAVEKLDKELTQKHSLQYLSSELKKVGFNAEMEGSLKRMINQGFPEFHLRYADVENRNAHYILHFKKIPQSDLYYFEKFDAISRPSLDSLLNGSVNCQRQTFAVHDNLKINAQEAERLVTGKAVYRRINGEDTWLMKDHLSVKNQLRMVEFDLEFALLQLPIKEREDYTKYQAVTAALKNGKTKEVTLQVNNSTVKYTLEVAPEKNTIHIFDKGKQLVDPGTFKPQQNATAVWRAVNEEATKNQTRGKKVG